MPLTTTARTHKKKGTSGFKNLLPRIQLAGIILLYPGFFFYHFGVSIGAFPPFLGGYYGPLTTLLLPLFLLLFLYGWQKNYIKINKLDASFFFLACYCLLWSFIYRIFGIDHQTDFNLFYQSTSGVLIWTTNYFLFRGDLDIHKRGLSLLFILGLGMLAIAWTNQGDGAFIARRLANSSTQEMVASYQGFSRSAVIVFFILMAWASLRWLLPIYYIGLVLLFLLSARSEFGGFILVGFSILAIRLGIRKLLLLASPALIIGFILIWDVAYGFSESSRVLLLMMNWQDDTSLASRLEMSTQAWQAIKENPLLGDYGSYLSSGSIGNYAHNILSVWAGFGLIGFFVFSYLMLSSMRTSIYSIKDGTHEGKICMSFALSLFCLILAVTAKFMFFPLFAACWGAAAGLIEKNNLNAPHRAGKI